MKQRDAEIDRLMGELRRCQELLRQVSPGVCFSLRPIPSFSMLWGLQYNILSSNIIKTNVTYLIITVQPKFEDFSVHKNFHHNVWLEALP